MIAGVAHNRFSPITFLLVLTFFVFFFLNSRVRVHDHQSSRFSQPSQQDGAGEAKSGGEEQLALQETTTPVPSPNAEEKAPPAQDHSPIQLPPEYLEALSSTAEWCNDRFETAYLVNLSRTQTEYCDHTVSTNSLRCFNTPVGKNGRVDSFCITGPSTFDRDQKKYLLDCQIQEHYISSIEQFPGYWYQTGPKLLMGQYLDIKPIDKLDSDINPSPISRKYTILIRREQPTTNLWHELMEISSMLWTLDILRISRDPTTNALLFTMEDVENTRILIEDERDEGPYFGLWTMFAKRPIEWMSKMSKSTVDIDNTEMVIFPLPGESNPMWQGDWEVHACDHSTLLNVFSKRVMNFYNTEPAIKKQNDSPLVLTFIDRREKRQLLEKVEYVQELQRTYPEIEVKRVDFAAKSFPEQLSITRNTDILVGVHGAGLTHALFLPPGSAIVEILPADFYHKGFRNLAHLMGHHYFSSHAVSNGTKGNWQYDDFSFDKNRFMQLVGAAVATMLNRGTRDDDVI